SANRSSGPASVLKHAKPVRPTTPHKDWFASWRVFSYISCGRQPRNGMTNSRSITQLLIDWSNGNRAALDELTPQVYGELHTLARTYLNRGRGNETLQPTAL